MNIARGATVMAVAVAWMRTQPSGAQFDYRQLARQAGVTEGAMYMALERERQRPHGGRIERVRNPRRKNGVLFRLAPEPRVSPPTQGIAHTSCSVSSEA